jgi:hypothetical protein
MKNLFIAFIALVLLSSCAKDITVSAGTGKGVITMKPTTPTVRTYVTINDQLVVDSKRVKSVTVTGLEEGENKVVYKSSSLTYKEAMEVEKTIVVKNNTNKTEILTVPPNSNGYWIYSGLSSVVSIVALLWYSLFLQ